MGVLRGRKKQPKEGEEREEEEDVHTIGRTPHQQRERHKCNTSAQPLLSPFERDVHTTTNDHDAYVVSSGYHGEPCSGVISPIPKRDVIGQLAHELVNWAEEVDKELDHAIQGEYISTYSTTPTPTHSLHTPTPPFPPPYPAATETNPSFRKPTESRDRDATCAFSRNNTR
jgi:hypothetical protein